MRPASTAHAGGDSRPPGGGREREGAQAPGRECPEHRVGRDRHPDRRRTEHEEGGGPARPGLGTEAPQGEQHRHGRRRRDDGHDEPGGEPAAQPEPHQDDEEQQRTRRMSRDVHRPVVDRVERDVRDVVAQQRRRRRSRRARSAGTRTACRGSPPRPAAPSTVARLSIQARPVPNAASSSTRHRIRAARSTAYRIARIAKHDRGERARGRRAASTARAAAGTTAHARSGPTAAGRASRRR